MASLVSADHASLVSSVERLADVVDDGLLAGIHLEGPWLSPVHAGAHDPELLADATPGELEALLEAGRGHVRMVTLAPERAGGLDAIRRLSAVGVTSAIGHTDATYDQARAALDAGATRRHPPLQRDARPAPPRARTGGRTARAPGCVRRAGRRWRPRPPGRAAAGCRRQAAPDRADHRRDGGRRGRGRQLPPRQARRRGHRRCRPAGRRRRDRGLDTDDGGRGAVRRTGGRAADRGGGPRGHCDPGRDAAAGPGRRAAARLPRRRGGAGRRPRGPPGAAPGAVGRVARRRSGARACP